MVRSKTAIELVNACARGGARVIEFTNRGEMAYPVFVELVKHFAKADPSVILGVGSIIDAPTRRSTWQPARISSSGQA